MSVKKFSKNDNGFVCQCCGFNVNPLGYTSRDHCPKCLTSLHVDINPGDRANFCKGLMVPVDVKMNSKGYVIQYKCSKCGELHNNKAADDDDFETILTVMNKTYNINNFKKKFNEKETLSL